MRICGEPQSRIRWSKRKKMQWKWGPGWANIIRLWYVQWDNVCALSTVSWNSSKALLSTECVKEWLSVRQITLGGSHCTWSLLFSPEPHRAFSSLASQLTSLGMCFLASPLGLVNSQFITDMKRWKNIKLCANVRVYYCNKMIGSES